MLKNVYILHTDKPESIEYLNDCLESCNRFPDINAIPFRGFTDLTHDIVCETYKLRPHRWRTDRQFEDFPGCFDLISNVDASHFEIWKKIIESGEPGVVLEHKAIVKAPIKDIEINDYEIVHFGPRILYEDDYVYPKDEIPTRVSVEQWEGVHAYAITPVTAQYMFDCLSSYGYIDSTDPMLAFRNTFNLNMFTLDPPVIVVANGGRKSTYTQSGVSAFWNSLHTPKYLENVKPGAKVADIRKTIFNDRSFDRHKNTLLELFKERNLLSNVPNRVITINANEGYESNWLGNMLLGHDDSVMHVLTSATNQKLCSFNNYFCWNYTKIRTMGMHESAPLAMEKNIDVKFDIVYCNGSPEVIGDKARLQGWDFIEAYIGWTLLESNGLLILDNYSDIVKMDLKALGHVTLIDDDLLVITKK